MITDNKGQLLFPSPWGVAQGLIALWTMSDKTSQESLNLLVEARQWMALEADLTVKGVMLPPSVGQSPAEVGRALERLLDNARASRGVTR